MGKEALPSLCPPGFWFRFNLVRFVLSLWRIRFSFVDSWARDEGLFLDDHVTLWSDSNLSSLVLKPPESRVHSNRSFWVLEKTRSCSVFLRFHPIHGVIHRFLPWTCSQVPCDHACKIWWDLDLIWSSNRQVFQSSRAGKTLFCSGKIFRYRRLNRRSHSFASDQPVSEVFTC